jgi:hypothetical protein
MPLGDSWNYTNSYEWMERLRAGFDPVIILGLSAVPSSYQAHAW